MKLYHDSSVCRVYYVGSSILNFHHLMMKHWCLIVMYDGVATTSEYIKRIVSTIKWTGKTAIVDFCLSAITVGVLDGIGRKIPGKESVEELADNVADKIGKEVSKQSVPNTIILGPQAFYSETEWQIQ